MTPETARLNPFPTLPAFWICEFVRRSVCCDTENRLPMARLFSNENSVWSIQQPQGGRRHGQNYGNCSEHLSHLDIRPIGAYQAGILAEYVPYTPLTAQNLKKLADLKPTTLAIMHGSSFTGDCARALGDLNTVYREVFGREKQAGASR
jgi:hypothetical protein